MKPIISLYGAAIHPGRWMDLYVSLMENNEIPFEIVFVGPNPPDGPLPDNFKFILSNVKPSQCMEIAARNTQGQLIVLHSDDVELTPHALDILYKTYMVYKDPNIIVSSRQSKLSKDGELLLHDKRYYRLWWDKPDSPKIPITTCMNREKYMELGGIDNRFIATCGDFDIYFRFFAQGGDVVYCDDVLLIESWPSKAEKKMRLSKLCGMKYDMKTLASLWIKNTFEVDPEYMKENRGLACNGEFSSKRLKPFLPYQDKEILLKSQGRMPPEHAKILAMRDWSKPVKLSIILSGRNDNFNGNFVPLLKKCIKSLAISLNGIDFEVILVDYNQVENSSPLSTLFPQSEYPYLRHIIYSRSDHTNFIDAHLRYGAKILSISEPDKILNVHQICQFAGPQAFNIAFKYARGEYILCTSADSLFPPGLNEIVENIQSTIVYRAAIQHMGTYEPLVNCNFNHIINNDIDKVILATNSKRSIKYRNKARRSKYNILKSSGDFILAHREIWDELGCFFSIPLPRILHSDSQFLLNALSMGIGIFYLDYSFFNPRYVSSNRKLFNDINYVISWNNITYDHHKEVEGTVWQDLWKMATTEFSQSAKRGEIIYGDVGYRERYEELKEMFNYINN